MIKIINLLFLLILLNNGFAQIIDNSNCRAFSDEPFFNQTFIKNNNIKRIVGRTSYKGEMDVIRKKKEIFIYEFDKKGRQTAIYWSFKLGQNTMDTSAVIFTYNDKNQLINKRRNDNHSFYSYTYAYNSLGRVINQKYTRDENISNSKIDFKQGGQFVIVSNSFEYIELNDTQYVKKYFNNHGKVYEQKKYTYNIMGYLLNETSRMVISRKTIKTNYSYNNRGLVSEKDEISTVMGRNKITNRYKYDGIGNLLEENIYRNDKHISERQVVYTNNMLIRSLLTREGGTNNINLIQYEYEFYN